MSVKPLPKVVIDSSAIIAILLHEKSKDAFLTAIETQCQSKHISAATVAELSIVVQGKIGITGKDVLHKFLEANGIQIEPFELGDLPQYQKAIQLYGKGFNPAGLNMGDLFSYTLAKKLNCPLLYQGLDFKATDIKDAMKMLGYKFTKEHAPIPEQGLSR